MKSTSAALPDVVIRRFHPKGSMCAACKNALEDCSRLDFSSMPVIQSYDSTHVVRCSEFKRK